MSFGAQGLKVIASGLATPLLDQLRSLPEMASAGRPGHRTFSTPALLRPLIGAEGAIGTIARALMGEGARPVRVLLFDKTAETNWSVPWHQDRTIAVKHRLDLPGFGPWSVKQGVHHVEPPSELLAGMVALRLHLDDCRADNGPLLAVPGSWKLGRVPSSDIRRHVETGGQVALLAACGDVVAMRGLSIHASQRADTPGHRRVVHVDYATIDLPGGLEWVSA